MLSFKPVVTVRIAPGNEQYPCSLDESLLKGMLKLGKRGIPAGCVSGGCGVCKVKVLEGKLKSLGPVSRAHVTEAEEAQGYTLACRVAPQEAVVLEVCAKLKKPFTRTSSDVQSPPSRTSPTAQPQNGVSNGAVTQTRAPVTPNTVSSPSASLQTATNPSSVPSQKSFHGDPQ